jgi:phosphoenolpyruvate carboxylase
MSTTQPSGHTPAAANFDSPVTLLYHVYNSLFLSLPFSGIEQTGTHLALFATACDEGFRAGRTAAEIIEEFWNEYFERAPSDERLDLLFRFIRYVERQVVLFDAVEDGLFEQLHDLDGPGSLQHLLSRLDHPRQRQALLDKIRRFSLRVVLTAHPTQFYPGKVLGIISDLGREIAGNHLENIRLLLMQLGKTAFVNRQRPTPYDEAMSLGWYLENVFYHALPDILFRLLRALGEDVTTFENPRLLSLGFWPGGDRDGNPHVTAETTRLVAARLREGVLRAYYRDLRAVRRRLTFRGTEEQIALAERRVYNTLYKPDDAERYTSGDQLIADLTEARRILLADHDGLFLDELDRFILKVRLYGFHFASLDLRQDSRRHTEVWQHILRNWNEKFPWYNGEELAATDEDTKINRLLTTNYKLDANDYADPFVKETILSFAAIPEIQRENGEAGCHRYVISNCQSALNVAEVLALARLSNFGLRIADFGFTKRPASSVTPAGSNESNPQSEIRNPESEGPRLDIVPLFETIDDLAHCPAIMERLYTNEHYARHLASRGNVQTIMLGFSDGTKDGGYLRANWSIYRAKEALTAVSRAHGVTVIFFDGRGGPPGRGGGNNAAYYAAHGPTIADNAIQVTIQGQTVSSTYGTVLAARYNLERLLTAGLENALPDRQSRHERDLSDEDRQLFEQLAEAAYHAYLELKNHADFVPYLERVTPLKWYGETNIASRPTKRGGGTALKFEDLRAIPFVGAWAQMKQNVPGFYGLGAALEALGAAGRADDLRRLYASSLFFRTLLDNSMQSLLKSNFDVTRHLAGHADFADFWKMLHDEYARTVDALKQLTGQQRLLSDNPNSSVSIAVRERLVLPLLAIQQYALQRLEAGQVSDTESESLRHMVLRAMFGIINAARNAA